MIFLSTLSLRRATVNSIGLIIHIGRFLSTLSLRRATQRQHRLNRSDPISIHALLAESDISCAWSASKLGDFYPRSPCGERLHYDNYNLHCTEISIHALLAESDNPTSITPTASRNFYPRSPCGERLSITITITCIALFLSTLSLRRATFDAADSGHQAENFYPRSPCGERLLKKATSSPPGLFLSTLSLRRATHGFY